MCFFTNVYYTYLLPCLFYHIECGFFSFDCKNTVHRTCIRTDGEDGKQEVLVKDAERWECSCIAGRSRNWRSTSIVNIYIYTHFSRNTYYYIWLEYYIFLICSPRTGASGSWTFCKLCMPSLLPSRKVASPSKAWGILLSQSKPRPFIIISTCF